MAKKFDFSCERFTGLNLSEDREHTLGAGESPEMVNFTVTDSYKLKKRKGYKVLCGHEGVGRGITYARVSGKDAAFYAVGKEVFCYSDGTEEKIGEIASESGGVDFLNVSGKLYILDGVCIKVWNGEKFSDIEPYRPLVAISTTPDGAGVSFEEKNILTGKMRQTFSPGANTVTLQLAATELDSIDYVHVGGRRLSTSSYTVDLQKGTVSMSTTAEEMLIPDGVEIGFTKNSGNENLLHSMRHAILFGKENDTRIFLYGDAENPDTIRYSGVQNGISSMEYFPENNFNKVGCRGAVKSIVRHYDRLMIFCESETFYSYMEESESESGVKYSVFPIHPLSDSVGCEAEKFAVLCNNFPITIDRNSLYRWRSSSIRDERYAENIGERIRRGMSGWDICDVGSFDSEKTGELFIYYSDECYVYNYNLDVFYYWKGIVSKGFVSAEGERILFLNRDGSLCALFESSLDGDSAVCASWSTPYLEFADGIKNLHRLDIETSPDINTKADIYWVSDHGERGQKSFFEELRRFTFEKLDFTNIGFSTGISSRRMSARVRHKRFEKMKLKFENNYPDSSLHILSYSTRGVITDKK